MKTFKIISEKIIFNNFYSLKAIRYSNALTECAHKSPGFISSTSYFSEKVDSSQKDNIKIITISDWENKDSWDKWINSPERRRISKEFQNIKKKEKFNRLFTKNVNDIFLM
tara:strand:+ start:410 stop:742 length:333 start_codon:yes stop_codon:yes gene_type:complete